MGLVERFEQSGSEVGLLLTLSTRAIEKVIGVEIQWVKIFCALISIVKNAMSYDSCATLRGDAAHDLRQHWIDYPSQRFTRL